MPVCRRLEVPGSSRCDSGWLLRPDSCCGQLEQDQNITWQAKPKKDKEALRQEARKKCFELLTTGLV